MRGHQLGVLAGVLLLALFVAPFVVDFGTTAPEPVEFDETVTTGLALTEELQLGTTEESVTLPRVQVFYTQYTYVVGYYGVEQFVAVQQQPAHESRFGHPAGIYVTDFAAGDVSLTDRGYPTVEGDARWTDAERAVYVVGSDATGPGAADTIVPFSDPAAAEAFVDEYGGAIRTWEEVLELSPEVDGAKAVRDRADTQQQAADDVVTDGLTALDRPTEVVVGEDVETIQEGIDEAPANTTVYVPAGTYEETVEIDRPVTVRGEEGAHVRGDGNGTVITVTASDAAITGVNVSGVGDDTADPSLGGAHGREEDVVAEARQDDANGSESWDDYIEDDYTGGDAAIAVEDASEVAIADVEIRTPAAGIVLRSSPDFVVHDVTVIGSESLRDAHMGVLAMRSPGVVEQSTIRYGFDAVYTHDADGIVVRDNDLLDNRMGVHTMFTSESLIANNTVSRQWSDGIHIMTGPERNAVVGNEVTNADTGIDIGGGDTYVADNVVADNAVGIRIDTDTTTSIVERNVVVDNRHGIEAYALFPTNRVVENDFVGNDRHVGLSRGPLRVWTDDGRGNYWEGAIGPTDGVVIDRPHIPTDGVAGQLHRTDGTGTLARAPAVDALAGFEGSIPGLRSGEVIDVAPLCEPIHEDWFEQREPRNLEPVCVANRPASTANEGDS